MHPHDSTPRIGRGITSVALAATVVALSGSAQAATVNVTAQNRTFVPASATVEMTGNEPGFAAAHAHVLWTMADAGTEHTVTFDDPKLVSSGPLGAGKGHEVLIYAAGTYPYRCTIHPGMAGAVVVLPEPATTGSATTAAASDTASTAAAPGARAADPAVEGGGSGTGVVLGVGAAGLAVAAGVGWLLRRRRAGTSTAGG